MVKNFVPTDFEKLIRASTEARSYQKYPQRGSPVKDNFTVEKIRELIGTGDPTELRLASRYFYRYSGIYSRMVEYLASLLLYKTIVAPIYDTTKPPKQKQIMDGYNKACGFIQSLNIPWTFLNITRNIIIDGIFYGVLRKNEDDFTIQELPIDFCRTRFKDARGMNIVEFDLRFFSRIMDKSMREMALEAYPRQIARAYNAYAEGKAADYWYEIPQAVGAFAFYYGDIVPFLVSSLPTVLAYDEAQDREARRDTNELYKLLVLEMPITKDNELIFDLTETAKIHLAISEMLKNNDNIDVITVFGSAKFENVQDTDNAASTNKLEKYKTSVFDEMGTSSQLFNGSGNISLNQSIQKDTSLMASWCGMYATWINYHLNEMYSKPNLSFQIEFLAITRFNQKEIVSTYLNAAQYGYPKLYAGVALGIDQTTLPSLINFENAILKLTEKMVPLQSSYTSSEKKSDTTTQKGSGSLSGGDLPSEGGRPQTDEADKEDRTLENQNSM